MVGGEQEQKVWFEKNGRQELRGVPEPEDEQ